MRHSQESSPLLKFCRTLGNVMFNNLIALPIAGPVILMSMFTYRYTEMAGQFFWSSA